MKYYLIIVAPRDSYMIKPALLTKITDYFKQCDLNIMHINELAENEAYAILLDHLTEKNIFLRELSILYQDYKLDFFISSEENYGVKKLLIADMDSTIIANECIDEIARYVGKYDEIAQITEAAMAGKINFENSLLARVSSLKSVTKDQLEEIYKRKIKLNKGAKILGKTMAKYNCHTILASGGFTFFTNKIRNLVSFKADYANKLSFTGDQLDGNVDFPVFGSQSKLDLMLNIAAEKKLTTNDIIAVGDGANDIAMLSAIELGVAYKAKWAVREVISNQINHTDLTSLLYLQGIAKKDFDLA